MNPASRILAIYDKAMNHPGNGISVLQLWGDVFGLAGNADHTQEDEITAGLMALRGEIDLAIARLADTGCPDQLYASYQANRLSDPTGASLGWPQTRASERCPLCGTMTSGHHADQ